MRKACRQASILALVAVILWTGGLFISPQSARAASALELYTPYTAVDAAPGESVSYAIELLNRGGETMKADIGFQNETNGWTYELTAGGRVIKQLAVKAGGSESLSLRLDVPLEIDKGEYRFTVTAGDAQLPLRVFVAEKGTFTSKLEVEQANIEGHADSSFTFSAKLTNQTAEEQTYALAAAADNGWEARFTSGGNGVTSVTVDPNASQTISVELLPPDQVKAGTYSIPIMAANSATKAETTLEAVITGTYGIGLNTADERLNATVKAGGTRSLQLIVTNTGTAKLEDISLTAQTPTDWEVTFEPKTIRSLEPGKTASVQAVIESAEQSLPGDYALNLSANTSQKSADAAIRVAVKSSSLWGWIGILIIAAVAGGIYWLFRTYGRR
ncbi:COG1470 family protein [Paenibacillus soyae]|uniref:NEW3 domain-containing protein n=1 Tax=Paenibacillus soyae TaxID=2969249 RepID=A0A9X2S8M9_9BACL|nr:NEW3 domain-containing protein [Paenibacillus soyae]MCR2802598.1 NEW3 domain-containing protein [Paenibacillus soyae]